MAPASMVVNARKFLADLDGKNTSSSSLSGASSSSTPPNGTAAALISPSVCRTFILGAECNDPLCTKRHYANDDLLEAMQQSRVNASKRGKAMPLQTATRKENKRPTRRIRRIKPKQSVSSRRFYAKRFRKLKLS